MQEQKLRDSFDEYKTKIEKAQEEAEEKRLQKTRELKEDEESEKSVTVVKTCVKPEEKEEPAEIPSPLQPTPPHEQPDIVSKKKGSAAVTGKIGHEDAPEEEVLKAPDSQEEQQRIRAIKRDLKLFYGGQDLDLTTDSGQDVDTPTKELQEVPVDCEQTDKKDPKSEQKELQVDVNCEQLQSPQESTDRPADKKDLKTKQKEETSEIPAAGLKTKNEMAGRIPRMGRRFASKSERNTPVREHVGEFKPVVRKKSADDLVSIVHIRFFYSYY